MNKTEESAYRGPDWKLKYEEASVEVARLKKDLDESAITIAALQTIAIKKEMTKRDKEKQKPFPWHRLVWATMYLTWLAVIIYGTTNINTAFWSWVGIVITAIVTTIIIGTVLQDRYTEKMKEWEGR